MIGRIVLPTIIWLYDFKICDCQSSQTIENFWFHCKCSGCFPFAYTECHCATLRNYKTLSESNATVLLAQTALLNKNYIMIKELRYLMYKFCQQCSTLL